MKHCRLNSIDGFSGALPDSFLAEPCQGLYSLAKTVRSVLCVCVSVCERAVSLFFQA